MTSVTLIYAGVLGLLAVLLVNYVLYVRLRASTLPVWQPKAAERVQANFVENVPIALILLYLVEVNGAPGMFVHLSGGALVLFRLLHAFGLARFEGANYPRLIGAQGTFLVMAVLGCMALLLAFDIVG
ncbi:MAG: putative membrane protein YecN with MAPEG domain [Candidatus Azotimanducaceae bacterium]